jgi:hypothetical protein
MNDFIPAADIARLKPGVPFCPAMMKRSQQYREYVEEADEFEVTSVQPKRVKFENTTQVISVSPSPPGPSFEADMIKVTEKF